MSDLDRITKKKALADVIGSAICDLANIAEDWNDSVEEPDERGRGNSAIGVIIFEDGSGYIAQFDEPLIDNAPLSNGTILHIFGSPEEVQAWFFDNISPRSLYD